jgi:hypothetical protein
MGARPRSPCSMLFVPLTHARYDLQWMTPFPLASGRGAPVANAHPEDTRQGPDVRYQQEN